MDVQPLFIELLVSGFFVIACFKWHGDFSKNVRSPREYFRLLPRLERLRRTRWQWFSMVLVLFVIRRQIGVPTVVEFTALAQFLIFLMLPVGVETTQQAATQPAGRSSRPAMRASTGVAGLTSRSSTRAPSIA